MGALLTATMKAKAASDKAVAQWWARLGLPTRRDQERTLHALNQLESRLIDLEEQLAVAEGPAEELTRHVPSEAAMDITPYPRAEARAARRLRRAPGAPHAPALHAAHRRTETGAR